MFQIASGSTTVFRPGHGLATRPELTGDLKDKVLQRDQYVCRSCRAPLGEFGEVEVEEGQEIRAEALKSCCLACCAPLRLHSVDQTSAWLIWLPELSQAVLAHFMRAVYVGRASPEMQEAASQLNFGIETRKVVAFEILGTNNPVALANTLMDLDDQPDRLADTLQRLSGIRLWHLNTGRFRDYCKAARDMPGLYGDPDLKTANWPYLGT